MAKKFGNYTLIVVDMQWSFYAARKCYRRVKKLIEQANKDKAPIIFLEYYLGPKSTPTMPSLIKAAKTYVVVEKDGKDGSKEVRLTIKNLSFPKNIKMCGIEFDCCVLETASSIAEDKLQCGKRFKIEVVQSACAVFMHDPWTMRPLNNDYINGKYIRACKQLKQWKVKVVDA